MKPWHVDGHNTKRSRCGSSGSGRIFDIMVTKFWVCSLWVLRGQFGVFLTDTHVNIYFSASIRPFTGFTPSLRFSQVFLISHQLCSWCISSLHRHRNRCKREERLHWLHPTAAIVNNTVNGGSSATRNISFWTIKISNCFITYHHYLKNGLQRFSTEKKRWTLLLQYSIGGAPYS